MANSYNGWPVDDGSNIDTEFNVVGIKYPGGVRKGSVSIVFRWFLTKLATLETPRGPLQTPPNGECWGWEVRADVNDPGLISCHASGTAVDHNATRHPNGSSAYYGWSTDQVAQIRAWLNEAQVIYWGADFSGTKDPMHFEIQGDQAAVDAAAIRLSGIFPPNSGGTMADQYVTVRDASTGHDYFIVAEVIMIHCPDEQFYANMVAAGMVTVPHGSATQVAHDALGWYWGQMEARARVDGVFYG